MEASASTIENHPRSQSNPYNGIMMHDAETAFASGSHRIRSSRDSSAMDENQQARLHRALEFMERHLGSRIGAREIANAACYSERHFLRLFRQIFGESLYEHLQRARMNRAATLLCFDSLSVSEIAATVGYDNHSAFSRAFFKQFHKSPREFRERTREKMIRRPPPFSVREVHMPAVRIAFLRHTGHPADSLPTWIRLLTWAWRQGLLQNPSVYPISIYFDPTDCPSHLNRCDVAITLPHDFTFRRGPVAIREIPDGLILAHDFRGTISGLEKRWDFYVEQWLPRSPWRPRADYSFDMFDRACLSPAFVASISIKRSTLLSTTLCIPVKRQPQDKAVCE